MISVIIPTFNEESTIEHTLKHVLNLKGAYEVIVVDGGSNDNTANIVRQFSAVHFLQASKGRALQMNHGAKNAKGSTLLFLHADTRLPDDALPLIEQAMQAPNISAGGFLHRFSGDDWRLRIISKIDNYRCRRSKVFYGDQALFISTMLFWQLEGFPPQDILEDWAFGQKLREVTTPVLINKPVITDSRKFEKAGICKSFIRVCMILTRLKFGFSPSKRHPFFLDIR